MNTKTQPTIALLHWGDLIEDFLDSIGISFEEFCNEMTGGWMFGYIDALRKTGIQTVLICVSARINKPSYFEHLPTGATICLLPVSKLYRLARHKIPNPYGRTIKEACGEVHGVRKVLLAAIKEVMPYFATPLILLARELKRQRCQAVLCQEYEYPRFDVCVILGLLLGLPVYATFQGGDFQISRIEHWLRPITVRASSGLIIGTRTEAKRVKNRYKRSSAKIAQIFNPMNVAEWSALDRMESRQTIGIPMDAQVVVSHGRIDIHRKGLDILLKAWVRLCRNRPERDLRLLLIGTGSDAKQFRQIIEEKKIKGIIWIDEYVRDRSAIKRYLSSADVYVMASRHEGFPVAPIEAMSCELPVVATDAPGVADILNQGESSGGLIVPGEDERALGSALGSILDNPDRAEKMGRSARLRAEKVFSPEVIGQQLKDFMLH